MNLPLTIAITAICATILTGILFVDSKIRHVEFLLTQADRTISKIEPSVVRVENLLERVDRTVEKGMRETKDNARDIAKELIGGAKDALK
jgi:hypothetical protein